MKGAEIQIQAESQPQAPTDTLYHRPYSKERARQPTVFQQNQTETNTEVHVRTGGHLRNQSGVFLHATAWSTSCTYKEKLVGFEISSGIMAE